MMGQVGRGSGGGEGLRGRGEGVVGALSVGGQADGKQPWGPGWGGRELQAVGTCLASTSPTLPPKVPTSASSAAHVQMQLQARSLRITP